MAEHVAPKQDAPQREGYSVDETAHTLGCGRVSVYKLLKEGKLRHIKIGARTIIPRSEIERFLHGA